MNETGREREREGRERERERLCVKTEREGERERKTERRRGDKMRNRERELEIKGVCNVKERKIGVKTEREGGSYSAQNKGCGLHMSIGLCIKSKLSRYLKLLQASIMS